MDKNSVLYKAMKKYRLKFLIINILATALLIAFAMWKMPYLKTKTFGASALDAERFLSETGTFTVDELVELDRHEAKEPSNLCTRTESYWQGDKYLFNIKVNSAEETGIVYKNKISMGNGDPVEYPSAEIYLAECYGRTFAVIAQPGIKPTGTVKGYLVDKSRPVISELSKNLENGDSLTLSEYFIDTRGLEMDTADTDLFIVRVWALIMILLFVKLGFYFAKPVLTPTYRQLRRYGDVLAVADEVNRQAVSADAYTEGKELVTKDFILSDASFKLSVAKNHMAKH